MADPFGRPAGDETSAPDYLGTDVPVAFTTQPALPVTGGPAIGSPTAPVTAGGFAPTAPSTTTGQPTAPLGGGEAPEDPSGLNLGAFIEPAMKLGNLAGKLFGQDASAGGGGIPAGAIPTPSGATTNTAPDVLSGEYGPGLERGALDPETGLWETDVTGGQPFPSPPASLFPSGEPIPDEIINMFGGDRAGFEAAVQGAQVPPETIVSLADAGELSGLGIENAASLTPDMISGLSTGIGIAGLILTGLKLAGVAEGEAARVAGSLLSLASGGVALAQAIPALTSLGVIAPETAAALGGAAGPALGTVGAIGSVAGGVTAVAAPFIAWGMHELEAAMRPNTLPATRRLNEQMFNATTAQIGQFNDLVDRVRAGEITDPLVLNQLLTAGQKAMLDFYNLHANVGNEIPGVGRDASPSGQVGGFDPATQGQMMEPYRRAMANIAALDQMLGGKATGSPEWYGIFGGQLNPWALNEALAGPGSASANPLGLNAAQYGERFTPEQLRAAAGGLDPLDFALQQFAQSSPGWTPQPWGA